jgi:hypothetical protein
MATSDDPLAPSPRHVARAEWTLVRGSPLARGLTFSFFLPLSTLLMLSVCVVASFCLYQLGFAPFPWPFVPLLGVWPLAVAWSRRTASSQAVTAEVFDDRVRFSSRRGEMVFPVATTRATLDVRESGGGKYGRAYQVWTMIILQSDASVFSLGAPGSNAQRSGRRGIPMHSCDRETLRAVGALWGVQVP